MQLHMKQKGFTLIELLVVVAIIGILAAVGTVAYTGYTAAAKRNATLAQHKQAEKFIRNTLALCDASGGTVALSSTRTINCNITNNSGNINSMNSIFIGHFLDLGWLNPYKDSKPVVYSAKNGAADSNGRMRFDETDCPGNSSIKQIALWVKTDKDYFPIVIAKNGWCD